jgi:hypothetical protein
VAVVQVVRVVAVFVGTDAFLAFTDGVALVLAASLGPTAFCAWMPKVYAPWSFWSPVTVS